VLLLEVEGTIMKVLHMWCWLFSTECDCQGNYMGLFCELEMFQSRLYSHGWNLL